MYRWAPFHHWSIQHGCQAIICLNRLSGYLAAQGQILMGDSLRSGDMGSLRGDGFIFSRNVRLDRFALAAGHDLTGAGRLRRDDNAAVVLPRYKDQREQEFCLVQGVTSFLQDGADLLKAEVSSLAQLTRRIVAFIKDSPFKLCMEVTITLVADPMVFIQCTIAGLQ